MSDEYIPTFHFAEISFADTKSTDDALRENSTRTGVVEVTHLSTGVGQHRVKAVVEFPLIFLQAPHFASGSAVKSNPAPARWHDPIGNAGVYGWQSDSRGYCTGAFIWVRVDAYPLDITTAEPPPRMVVTHFLTFTGQAVKNLRAYEGAATLSSLAPRAVGI